MTTSDDLVAGLLSAIEQREKAALAASSDWERPSPDGGEHWLWVRSGHYDPLIDEPVDLDAEDPEVEHIADGNPVSLRSVEEYATQSVGPLPHFVVNGEGETAPGPAWHIVMNDPRSVLRLCRAHRTIIEQFEHVRWVATRLIERNCSMGLCVVQQRAVNELERVLRALAEGYGLREENSDGK